MLLIQFLYVITSTIKTRHVWEKSSVQQKSVRYAVCVGGGLKMYKMFTKCNHGVFITSYFSL